VNNAVVRLFRWMTYFTAITIFSGIQFLTPYVSFKVYHTSSCCGTSPDYYWSECLIIRCGENRQPKDKIGCFWQEVAEYFSWSLVLVLLFICRAQFQMNSESDVVYCEFFSTCHVTCQMSQGYSFSMINGYLPSFWYCQHCHVKIEGLSFEVYVWQTPWSLHTAKTKINCKGSNCSRVIM
jgi:hypothetical protein